ncbi:MAG: hypothetical protein II908_05675 [Bacteroidaceae bacterium]|nr:hypothetical protein [Bacteroidaceae bacterium]
MNKIFKIASFMLLTLTFTGLQSCNNDDYCTYQYDAGIVRLNAYGPNPVIRGGQLRFVGSNLDRITKVEIPGVSPITNIEVVKKGTESEIRVTVPKDGPEIGFVTLTDNTDAKYTTKTKLEYTENISFDKFAPATAMPGEEITISGDYLNNVHMVEFAENVYVSEDEFTKHDRYEIKVVVPEAARTGKISLYDKDITKQEDSNADVSYNIIKSEDALIVGTPVVGKISTTRSGAVDALGTVTAKMNETITISGDYLNLVSSFKFGEKVSEDLDNTVIVEDYSLSDDNKTISFTLPATAPDGDFSIVCTSGVLVPVGKVVTIIPTECVASPAPVKAGETLTISGKDLDVVSAVSMLNISNEPVEATFKYENGKIAINPVPEKAVEGNLTLHMANGNSVAVPFTLVKPAVTSYSTNSVSAGGVLSINGTNLDLVKKVTFNGSENPVEVTAENNGTVINLTVPMDSQTGAPTLTLVNGTTVECPSISIVEAVFCYATELPGEDAENKAGETLTIKAKNIDKLTSIEINGEKCQYVVSKDQIIIGIPENASAQSTMKLISSNGEISYNIAVIPNTERTTVIWNKGPVMLTWSAEGQIYISDSYFNDIAEGTVLHLYITQTENWGQIQLNNGSWSQIPTAEWTNNGAMGYVTTSNINDASATCVDITLTKEVLDNIRANAAYGNALIFQGQDIILNKVTMTEHISLETTIWKGEKALDWGDGNRVCLPASAFETAKAKQKVRFYYSFNTNAWGCMQLFDGAWTGLVFPSYEKNQIDVPSTYPGTDAITDGVTEVELTSEIIAQLLANRQDCGAENAQDVAVIIQGSNCTMKKVTIE